jgi:ATP-dependent helicase HrpB
MSALPIDEILPQVRELAVADSREGFPALIIEAPPGAGKTTRVPVALAEVLERSEGQILVTEPRRVAAKLSAARVAEEQGVALGQEIGYRVRFDEKASSSSRVVYLTEGILLRRLMTDPELLGVRAVVFDEVHERSATLDLLLALCSRLATRRKEPLLLVAMSATLDASALEEYWPSAPRLRSEGRAYPVAVQFQDGQDDRPVEIQVRSALRSALAADDGGDVLVFLPGAHEIRKTASALSELNAVEVLTLHGDQTLDEQTKVLRPARPSERKRVVLATNIAETSVTIPGVTTVIDCGLARVQRFDAFAGVERLVTVEISQARLIQRAGRAGRTGPGRVFRLFTEANYLARPASDTPEIRRTNLAEVTLTLRGLGLEATDVRWLTDPGATAFQRAQEELMLIGALDSGGALTSVGRRMLELPLPLRAARFFVEAEALGLARAALLVALLSERDPLMRAREVGSRESGPSDLLERLERVLDVGSRADSERCRSYELDRHTVAQLYRIARQLEGLAKRSTAGAGVDQGALLTRCLLAAFPDRVCQRREKGRELLSVDGFVAELDGSSVVTEGRYLVAASWDAPERARSGTRARPVVRLAHVVREDELMDQLASRVEARETYEWNAQADRVDVRSGFYLGALTLDESLGRARPGPEAARELVRVLSGKGPKVYDPEARLEGLRVRLALLKKLAPDLLSEPAREELLSLGDDLAELGREALEEAGMTRVSLAEVLEVELDTLVENTRLVRLKSELDRLMPREVLLSGGLRLKVHYEEAKPPWIEARLQNFFSMVDTPRICQGRLPLAIQLLAPNHRPVQVTSDLAGFWERHYPTLRKELMRRYPKHLWPEDGKTARPPAPGKIR